MLDKLHCRFLRPLNVVSSHVGCCAHISVSCLCSYHSPSQLCSSATAHRVVLSRVSPSSQREGEEEERLCTFIKRNKIIGLIGLVVVKETCVETPPKKKTPTTHPAASRTSHPRLHVHNPSNLHLKTEERCRCGFFFVCVCVIFRCILFFHLQQPTDGGRSKPAARLGSQIFHAASPPSPSPPPPPRACGYKNPQTPSLSGSGLN